MEEKKVDIIIIGAGLSGMAAAKLLHDTGLNILVLEARDRVGGRTHTKRDPSVGGYVDLGGSYVGPMQNHIRQLAKEMDVELYNIFEDKNIVFYQNGKRWFFNRYGLPAFWNPFVIMDYVNLFYLIDKMGEEIPYDAPWDAPRAQEWDKMTARDFSQKYLWTKSVRNFFENCLVPTFVANAACNSSLLWILWYIKQGYGSDCIFNAAQSQKFVGGSQTISDRIKDYLGDKVLLGKPVHQIQQTRDMVTVTTVDGREYKGRYAISAVPLPLLQKIHFEPSLPSLKNQLIQRTPMGSVMKSIIYYRRRFWTEKKLCGSGVVSDESLHVSYFLDDSKPDGSFPAIICFIPASRLLELMVLPKEIRLHHICSSLAKILDCPEALEPVRYEEKIWIEEQYSGGCYTVTYSPGCLTSFGHVLREPFNRLYFAGTETAVRWTGYMDGAVSAGRRAAREILAKMGRLPQGDVWKDELLAKNVPTLHDTSIFEYLPSALSLVRITKATLVVGLLSVLFYRHRHAIMI